MATFQPTHIQPEEWRDVPGYEGYYQVSNHGRVRSLDREVARRDGTTATLKGVNLRADENPKGHLFNHLCRGGRREKKYIHRLVLEAFVGPCPAGMEACHWDDNPANNHLTNLRWASPSQNLMDRVRNMIHHEAQKTHCKRGHMFTPENIVNNGGNRNCRKCTNAGHRARRVGMTIDEYVSEHGWGWEA